MMTWNGGREVTRNSSLQPSPHPSRHGGWTRASGARHRGDFMKEIASRKLWAECPTRGGFEVTLQLGTPYRASAVDWACPVAVLGLHKSLADQHGVDSWQAVIRAQSLVQSILQDFVDDGGRLFETHGGQSVDMSSLFHPGSQPAAPPDA